MAETLTDAERDTLRRVRKQMPSASDAVRAALAVIEELEAELALERSFSDGQTDECARLRKQVRDIERALNAVELTNPRLAKVLREVLRG